MRFEYNLQGPDFRVGQIDILNVARDQGYRHTYRGRPQHALIYTISGRMRNEFPNETIDVAAGELFFIPKGATYSGVYFEKNTEIKIIQFDLLSGDLPPYFKKPAKLPCPNAAELIEAFFTPVNNHIGPRPFCHLSCFYALMQEIDDCCFKLPSKYKRLQPALSALAQHYRHNEKIAYYAALCDMSEVGFRRLFREYTGASPVEYRNALRLQEARARLHSGEYNVSETAEAVGFTNLSFFIRLYKKKYGCTPKKE